MTSSHWFLSNVTVSNVTWRYMFEAFILVLLQHGYQIAPLFALNTAQNCKPVKWPTIHIRCIIMVIFLQVEICVWMSLSAMQILIMLLIFYKITQVELLIILTILCCFVWHFNIFIKKKIMQSSEKIICCPTTKIRTKIITDVDTLWLPPSLFLFQGWWLNFALFKFSNAGVYHRLRLNLPCGSQWSGISCNWCWSVVPCWNWTKFVSGLLMLWTNQNL